MSNKLSFILYEEHNSPRYFEIKKSFLRFLIYGLPLVALLSFIGAATFGVYFKQIRTSVERKEPKMISDLRDRSEVLSKERDELTILNNKLVKKLGASTATSNIPTLGLFKAPPGQEDHTKTPAISIDQFKFKVTDEGKNLFFRFDLINEVKEQGKIAGYLFVIMKMGGSLYFYPQNSMAESEMLINYTKGEFFSMNNRRITEGTFPLSEKNVGSIFKILIFSRTGDLLHKRIISQQIEL
jgi:hypothetical protein